jgi:chromosome segregation ATPase
LASSPSHPTDSPANSSEKVLEELTGLQAALKSRQERILSLEQALDQTLVWLKELQCQLRDQQLLENQLVATEDIANLQHQEINRLKQELAQSFRGNTEELAEALHQDQQQLNILIGEINSNLNSVKTDLPLFAIPGLAAQLDSLNEVWTQHIQRLTELEALVADRQAAIASLSKQLESLQQDYLEQDVAITLLKEELKTTHAAVQELEIQATRQAIVQAQWQHRCQELETERDRQQTRIHQLEQQATQMQEQILRQAQDASEYEAAVQHWRDRSLWRQQLLNRFREVVDPLFPQLPEEILQLLEDMEALDQQEALEQAPESALARQLKKGLSVDLPAFLAHRRLFRADSKSSH